MKNRFSYILSVLLFLNINSLIIGCSANPNEEAKEFRIAGGIIALIILAFAILLTFNFVAGWINNYRSAKRERNRLEHSIAKAQSKQPSVENLNNLQVQTASLTEQLELQNNILLELKKQDRGLTKFELRVMRAIINNEEDYFIESEIKKNDQEFRIVNISPINTEIRQTMDEINELYSKARRYENDALYYKKNQLWK